MSIQQIDNADGEQTSTSGHALAGGRTLIGASAQQAHELLDCEATIKQVLVEGLFQAGAVLRRIRDEKMYESIHDSFDEYIARRWGWSTNYVHRLIVGAKMYEVLAILPIGKIVLPTAESQVRPLAHLKDPDKQRAAWQLAVETAGGCVPTAEQVKVAVLEMSPPPPPKGHRAKPTTRALVLDQTPPHDVAGNNDNPPPTSDDEDARDRTESEGHVDVELAPVPIRGVLRDDNEFARDADVLSLTVQSAAAGGSEPDLPRHMEDDPSGDTNSEGIGQRKLLEISKPESDDAGKLRVPGEGLCNEGHEARPAVLGEGDPNEPTRLVLESKTAECPVSATVLADSSKPLDDLVEAKQDRTAGEEVAPQTSPVHAEPPGSQHDEPSADEGTPFSLADGSNIVSPYIADGERIVPQEVQRALDAVGRKSASSTATRVTTQQRAVVFLAEHVNQAIKADKSLDPAHVLNSMGSALVLWQGLLKKKGSRK